MKKTALYKYSRLGGGTTITDEKPQDTDYIMMYALKAEDGKMLWKGDKNLAKVVYVEDAGEEWEEVDEKADVVTLIKARHEQFMNVKKEKPFKPSQDAEETIARLIKENNELKEQLELQQKQYTEQKEKTKQIEDSLLNLSMNVRAEKVKQKVKEIK